jgi:hypothetical protein
MSIDRDLIEIFERLEIQSPAMLQFGGEAIPVNQSPVPPQLAAIHPLPSDPLIRELQSLLYLRCYTQRLADGPLTAEKAAPDPNFIARLSAANRSNSGWEGGWSIYEMAATGQAWLVKGDRQRTALPGEYITSGTPGMMPQSGQIVQVQVPRESATAQAGFYFIYGETLADVWDERSIVRFYFHAPYEIVPDLISEVSFRLNRFRVPFQMKALNDPLLYERTDAAVLYVARRHAAFAARLVGQLPQDVIDGLRASVPLFTRKLRRGVGTAEDPGTGESFGMHRCRLVAEGVVDAWRRGEGTNAPRLRSVEARFRMNGLKLSECWLGAGSADDAAGGLDEATPREVQFAHA